MLKSVPPSGVVRRSNVRWSQHCQVDAVGKIRDLHGLRVDDESAVVWQTVEDAGNSAAGEDNGECRTGRRRKIEVHVQSREAKCRGWR